MNKQKQDNTDVETFDDGDTRVADTEAGVWIVYDLEANRKIQELLTKNKFAFKFNPSLRILEQETLTKIEKLINKVAIKSRSLGMNLISPLELKNEIRRLKWNEEQNVPDGLIKKPIKAL